MDLDLLTQLEHEGDDFDRAMVGAIKAGNYPSPEDLIHHFRNADSAAGVATGNLSVLSVLNESQMQKTVNSLSDLRASRTMGVLYQKLARMAPEDMLKVLTLSEIWGAYIALRGRLALGKEDQTKFILEFEKQQLLNTILKNYLDI